MSSTDCIFCKLATGKIPTKFLYEDELVVAFRDLHPVAPVHVLVIPKAHVVSLAETKPEDEVMLGRLLTVARKLGEELGMAPTGYRTVINTGGHGGQSVFHLHLHLLGERQFGWPPG